MNHMSPPPADTGQAASVGDLAEPLLRIERLDLRWTGLLSGLGGLHDVSLTVAAGEIVAVIDEHGTRPPAFDGDEAPDAAAAMPWLGDPVDPQAGRCRPSLIARLLSGLAPPAGEATLAGHLRMKGEDLLGADAAAWRRLRGPVIGLATGDRHGGLCPDRPVEASLAAILMRRRPPERRQARRVIESALAALHLPDPRRLMKARPRDLPPAQCQRIGLAAALLLDPVLLVADDPAANLDTTASAQILDLIAGRARAAGTAVLLVTPDPAQAFAVATRIVVLRHGRMVEAGTPDTLRLAPVHDVTRALVARAGLLVPPEPVDPRAAIALGVTGLSKTHRPLGWPARRPLRVLEDVTLHVKRGERLALVGEAGSGKTALARCLAGLGTFADGEARLDGTLLPAAPTERAASLAQAVRLVPGDMARAFDPRHPLIDALAQAPMARGQSAAQARAAALEMMDLTGLPRSFAQARPVALPPPAARRAGLARALLAAPHVVLLEDWFGGCDALAQAGLARLVEDMQERFSVGVILVTHDLRDAARLCHRTAIMARGRIVEDGPTGDLLDNPRHPYTQALLAALPRAPRP